MLTILKSSFPLCLGPVFLQGAVGTLQNPLLQKVLQFLRSITGNILLYIDVHYTIWLFVTSEATNAGNCYPTKDSFAIFVISYNLAGIWLISQGAEQISKKQRQIARMTSLKYAVSSLANSELEPEKKESRLWIW